MPKNKLPRITDATDLKGKRIFLRSALDVPIEDGVVTNQFRLMRGLATIQYLVDQEAKVILAGHVGRDTEYTLQPVYEVLKQHLDIQFSGDVAGASSQALVDAMKNGQVVLLENLRKDPREVLNDPEFAHKLAALGEIYVNDAFSVAHREHASMVGVPALLRSYAGLNFTHECEELAKALKPKSPSLFLLGGAKFDTKMPLVEKFLDIYDHVFVGGALANDFFKAKELEIGESLVSDVDLKGSPLLTNPKILLPVDVTVQSKKGVRVTTPDDVQKDEKILDAGPATVDMLAPYIKKAQMVLWNGPYGDYEHGFAKATEGCALLIAEADGYSVIGGGDTVAAIEGLHKQNQYDFLSTAGGAMLTFLEKGTLPAIEAIRKS